MDRKQSISCLTGTVIFFCLFCFPGLACAQNYYNVDCSGTQSWASPTINSALPLAVPGDYIVILGGPCTENVNLNHASGIYLGALYGTSVNLVGNLSISDSQNLFIYGLNITSASTSGISVQYSQDVIIDSCTSNNNAGNGLNVGNNSSVQVQNFGSFNNNSSEGIHVEGSSQVGVLGWGGLIDISSNSGAGVYAARAEINILGNARIANNKAIPGSPVLSGFGIDFRGAARGLLLGLWAPLVITGNEVGGISLQENSELSICGGNVYPGWTPVVIQSNGPTGISAAFGSQLTLYSGDAGVQVLNHSSVGVDVYANSQAFFHGDVQIQHNGFGSDAMRAGMRVDGDSEAFLRGGEFVQNSGPGILALVNSSVDFSGTTFQSNGNGPIVCDSSAYMVTDSFNTTTNQWTSVPCKMPHNLGNHRHFDTAIDMPDWSRGMALEQKYAKVAVRRH